MSQFDDQAAANGRLPLASDEAMHPILVGAAAKLPPICFSAAQRAAFEFAQEAIELVQVGDAAYESAARYFSPRALTEILYVVGSYMFLSRLIRSGGVPLDEHPAEVPAGFLQ